VCSFFIHSQHAGSFGLLQSELDGELGASVRAAFEARAAQLQQELESR
jgi:hypothetical protein